MFIDDTELESLLKKPDNLVNRHRTNNDIIDRKNERVEQPTTESDKTSIAPLNNGGRRQGDGNIPSIVRGVIGASARLDTLKNVSEEFGVSLHHAHELKHGVITDYKGQDDELIEDINKQLKTPHDLAVDKLTETLLAITPEKISLVTKVKDLASIANSLSAVAERSAPVKKDSGNSEGAKLIVYAPIIQNENHYEKVTVNRG